MEPNKKLCTKMACLIADGERTYYKRQFTELQSKYDRLEQEFSDFKSFMYNVINLLKERN